MLPNRIKLFSRTGCNIANARKLQNMIGNFNNRSGYEKYWLFIRMGYHFSHKPFLKWGMGLTFEGLRSTNLSPPPPSGWSIGGGLSWELVWLGNRCKLQSTTYKQASVLKIIDVRISVVDKCSTLACQHDSQLVKCL